MTAKKSVAVVLGSGSVKCAAALGMFRVLEREQIDVDLIVGCSGGSLFATLRAIGMSAEESEQIATELWTAEITKKRNRRNLMSILLPKQLGFSERFGIIDDKLIMDRLKTAFGQHQFADMKIPLYITACDFHNGDLITLNSGSVVDAIRASISIPFLFPPHPVGDRLLIDGFMADPLPVGVAIQNGANVILAMGFETAYSDRFNHIGRFASQMTSIMKNNLLKAKFAFNTAIHHEEVIPILPQLEDGIKRFDVHRIPYLIEQGEKATEAQLPYIRRLLNAT